MQDCSLASKVLKLPLPQFPLLYKQGHAAHPLPWLEDTLQLGICLFTSLRPGDVQRRDSGWGLMSVYSHQVPSLLGS